MYIKKETYAVASVKAFIHRDGKILILRESPKYQGGSHHGKFVMPGGKVSEGEHFQNALRREVKEECGLEITIDAPFHVDEWKVNVPGKPKHVVGTYFGCSFKSGVVRLNNEFDTYEWIRPEEYKKYDINPAARRAFATYVTWKK